jgi:hypothetical protein
LAPAAATGAAGVSSSRAPYRVCRRRVAEILIEANGLISQSDILKRLRLPKSFPNPEQCLRMALCRLRVEDGYAIERVSAYRVVKVP